MHTKAIKICLAASSGGHLSQLLKLSDSWKSHKTFCVTTTDVIERTMHKCGKVYVVGECNRDHPLKVARVLVRCLGAVFREKPDVVISTGAAAGCMVCFISKLIGAKVVWIDSITNMDTLSLSGRMVRYIADLIFVQWPDLAAKYKTVEYSGAVI